MKTCPLGHTCANCLWLTRVRGVDKNTGEAIDKEGCAVAFLPTLLIEVAQMERSTGGAVEGLRNEVVRGQADTQARLARLAEASTEGLLTHEQG